MRKRRKVMALAMSAFVLVAVACSSDEGAEDTSDQATGGDLGSLKIAWTTEANSYIPQSKGPIEYGPEFGLNQEDGDISEFEAHSTAVNLLLSGDADVLAGAFIDFVLSVDGGRILEKYGFRTGG